MVLSVVLMLLAKLPGIYALRDELRALHDFDAVGLDDLYDLTRALLHAHGLYLQATKASVPLQGLVARLATMKARTPPRGVLA